MLRWLYKPWKTPRGRLLHRPEQSKVTLQKTTDSLEIYIPLTKPSRLARGVFVIVFLALILGGFLTAIHSGSWLGGLISLFLLSVVAAASFQSIFQSKLRMLPAALDKLTICCYLP